MSRPRGVCSVCLAAHYLTSAARPRHHWARAKDGKREACPGTRFPHMGESTLGTHWALDVAAGRLASLQDALLIHGMSPMMRDTAAVLAVHGFTSSKREAEDQLAAARRTEELELGIKECRAELDRLAAALAEWEPGGALAGRSSPQPIIHLRWLWRDRPGTAVPKCWSQALRRPTRDFILTDDIRDVTCREGCAEKSSIKTA